MIIKKLELQTNDLMGTTAFYEQVLEWPVIKKSSDSVSFSVGHSIITFRVTPGSDPFYHFAFSIPANKVEEAYTWISERLTILPFNGSLEIVDFSNWNARAFYFHDNQQNILEFISHQDLNITSPNPFSASSILGICEIGIPVKDVTKACESINNCYNIPWFHKGPRFDEFAVMGDDYGLLIVTKTGRGWLPTHRPAEQHDIKVYLENNEVPWELFFGDSHI